MREFIESLRRAFAPPTEAWWFPMLAATLIAILTTFFVIGVTPRRFSAPILPGERRVARASRAVRWLLAAGVPLAAVATIGALVVLAFSPRRAVVVTAHSGVPPADPTAHVPESLLPLLRESADPLIDEVLARAANGGAASWVTPSTTALASLHATGLDVITAFAHGTLGETRPRPAVPRWVEDTVSLTVVQGVLRVRNAAACVLIAGPTPHGRGWNRAAGTIHPERTELVVVAPTTPPRAFVKVLFDGRAVTGNTRVGFQAVVEGVPDGPPRVELAFAVRDPATDRRAVVRRTVANVPTQRLVVEEPVSGFAPTANLVVTAEADTVRTPLLLNRAAGPVRVNLRGPGSGVLRERFETVLGTAATPTAVRNNLVARGLSLPAWGTADPNAPTVAVRAGHGVLILAAGLSADAIPHAVTGSTAPPPQVPEPSYGTAASLTTTGVPFAGRVTEVTDGPATMDSFMSSSLAVTAGVPTTATGVTVTTRATWLDRPLAGGRYLTDRAFDRPVVEVGTADDKPFAFVRLDPATDLPLDGTAPSRARAFVAAVVFGVNAVAAGRGDAAGSAAADPASAFEPAPLLTVGELDDLTALGSRRHDGAALAVLGGCLGLTAAYLLLFLNRKGVTS